MNHEDFATARPLGSNPSHHFRFHGLLAVARRCEESESGLGRESTTSFALTPVTESEAINVLPSALLELLDSRRLVVVSLENAD